MVIVKVVKLECLRCKHKWIPKKADVRRCGKCKSPYWDKLKELK